MVNTNNILRYACALFLAAPSPAYALSEKSCAPQYAEFRSAWKEYYEREVDDDYNLITTGPVSVAFINTISNVQNLQDNLDTERDIENNEQFLKEALAEDSAEEKPKHAAVRKAKFDFISCIYEQRISELESKTDGGAANSANASDSVTDLSGNKLPTLVVAPPGEPELLDSTPDVTGVESEKCFAVDLRQPDPRFPVVLDVKSPCKRRKIFIYKEGNSAAIKSNDVSSFKYREIFPFAIVKLEISHIYNGELRKDIVVDKFLITHGIVTPGGWGSHPVTWPGWANRDGDQFVNAKIIDYIDCTSHGCAL